MNFRKIFLTLLACFSINSFASAALSRYVITKITDSDITKVTRGKDYFFNIQGVDASGAIAPNQASVNIDCGGITPCNMVVVAPARNGGGSFDPDPNGLLTVVIRFTNAPESVTLRAYKDGTAGINATMALSVEKFPDHFVVTPSVPSTTAGVPFNVTVTALNGTTTIESFRDSVNLYDDIIGSPIIPINGSDFNLGVANQTFTLYAGTLNTRINKIHAANSGVYVGQASPATGVSANILVDPTTYNRVVQIFPGETLTPGIAPGKNINGILNQVAGAVNPVNVYAVDQFFNPVITLPGGLNINFTSNIAGDTVPGLTSVDVNPKQFNAGEFRFPTVGQRVIEVVPSINPGNSSQSTVTVNAGAVDHYLITDQPAASPTSLLTADVPFKLEIRAYDSLNNLITTFSGSLTNSLSATLMGPGGDAGTKYVDTNPYTDFPDNQITFDKGIAVIPAMLITKTWPNVQLTFTDGNGKTVSSNVWQVQTGSPKRIHLTILGSPGEAFTEGIYPGNSGTPPVITAGQSVQVEARLTDGRWNVVDSVANVMATVLGQTNPFQYYIVSSPSSQLVPPSGRLVGGQTFNVVMRTAGVQTLTATASGGATATTTSSQIQVIPAAYAKIALVGPGETLSPGVLSSIQIDGKTGSITSQNVGTPFKVDVFATDAYWNPIQSFTYPKVGFNFDDPNAIISPAIPMVMGASQESFMVTLQSLLLPQITAYDTLTPSISQTISINANPGALHHFVMSTIPSPQAAGEPFVVTVQAQDQFNNTIPQSRTVDLSVNTGPGRISPTQVTLDNSGTWTGSVTVFAATTTSKITMSTPTSPNATRTSNTFRVNVSPQGYKKLILLMDGEKLEPGLVLGKSGAPTSQVVGTLTTVRAISCDPYSNPLDTTGIVELSSNHYAQFGTPNGRGDLSTVDGHGEFSTTLLMKTATTHTIQLRDINQPSVQTSSSVVLATINPNLQIAFKKLQILLPEQVPDPGTSVTDGTTGTGKLPRKAGVMFDVTVRAVDEYWNLVPINGGNVQMSADKTAISFIPVNGEDTPTNDPRPYVNGVSTRGVIVGEQGNIKLIAEDLIYATKGQATLDIDIQPGAVYKFSTPAQAVAGQNFPVTITLEDENGPIANYNQSVYLTASFPSGGTARGAFTPDGSPIEFVMNNGSVTIPNLSYNYVEAIQIKLTDKFSRLSFSNVIDVIPSGLKYSVSVPTSSVIVGPPSRFDVTVQLLEKSKNTLVKNHDHDVDVQVISALNPTTDGSFDVTTVSLKNGVATFQEAYTKAEPISIKVSESATAGDPNFVIPSNTSNPVTVKADGYKKLLILFPGETHNPGVPSATGKTTPPFTRQSGVSFLVQVRGVDQYWNVADSFSGGKLVFSTDETVPSFTGTNPQNQNGPLVNGEAATTMVVNTANDVNITVRDDNNAAIASQTQKVKFSGNRYEITVPPQVYAGAEFTMSVVLKDSITGNVVTDATHFVELTPMIGTTPASGALGINGVDGNSVSIVNGVLNIPNQTYNTAEDITIRVVEKTDKVTKNTGVSSLINFIPRKVRYDFEISTEAHVNEPFNIVVRTYDEDTKTAVKNLNRFNDLEAWSAITGAPATGIFTPSGSGVVNIVNGVARIQATYTKAETIYFKMTDNTANSQASSPTQKVFTSQSSVVVKPGRLAGIDLNDFTMQSNQTVTLTLTAMDSLGNSNPNKAVNLSIESPELPGFINMNGQRNVLKAITNSLGQLDVRFEPSSLANGQYNLVITDGDEQTLFSKQVKITVLGFPSTPARALPVGGNRIFLNATLFLPDIKDINPKGGTVRTHYRIDGGDWQLYSVTDGIKGAPGAAAVSGGFNGFNQVRQYNVDWYSEICYDVACSNPVSQLDVNGGPLSGIWQAVEVADKLVSYPNPFNPKNSGGINFATLQYTLDDISSVDIDIYDLFGQKVWHKDINPGETGGTKGTNEVYWYGINDDGVTVANGGYVVRVKVGTTGQVMKTKVLVVK